MKIKMLNKMSMIRNINGLSVGDRAYCGPYGTIKCTSSASEWSPTAKVPRKFSVSGCTNGVLKNRGNYTITQLRDLISK